MSLRPGSSSRAGRERAARIALAAAVGLAFGCTKPPAAFSVTHVVVGSGPQPSASDTVRVNYEGKLADGTVFDSSYARHEPAVFPLGGVIPCWTQGVAQMKVGGTATLVCPPELAYGPGGVSGQIPPNATLTFKVELLGIEGASAPPR